MEKMSHFYTFVLRPLGLGLGHPRIINPESDSELI